MDPVIAGLSDTIRAPAGAGRVAGASPHAAAAVAAAKAAAARRGLRAGPGIAGMLRAARPRARALGVTLPAMAGFLSTLRTLFVGRDDAEQVRRVRHDRVDADSALPVPADSQEIVTMAREFRAFLDLQDQRQQELARVVAALPQSMGSLPELVRQQTRLADLVAQQLMHTRQRDDQVEKTLARITQGVEQQRDVMGLVQQQLDLNHESAMKVADGVTTLANAVVHLQGTTDRSSAALQGLLERTAERDAGIQKLHTSLQNWMLFVSILASMTLFGGVILVWVGLEGGRPATSAPTAAPATAAVAPAEPAPAEAPAATGADEPATINPAATVIPALGGAPQPASGAVVPATGGAAPSP